MAILEEFYKRAQMPIPIEVVYHGTTSEIEQFNLDQLGERSGYAPQEGPGIYFTSHPRGAMMYGGIIYRVQVDPDANLIGDNEPGFTEEQVIHAIETRLPEGEERREWTLSNWDEDEQVAIRKLAKAIMVHKGAKDQMQQMWVEMYETNDAQFANDMRSIFGIDGLISERTGSRHTHYTIFNPRVLSITGTVNPDSDDPDEWE
jgi:hypothetical protein